MQEAQPCPPAHSCPFHPPCLGQHPPELTPRFSQATFLENGTRPCPGPFHGQSDGVAPLCPPSALATRLLGGWRLGVSVRTEARNMGLGQMHSRTAGNCSVAVPPLGPAAWAPYSSGQFSCQA